MLKAYRFTVTLKFEGHLRYILPIGNIFVHVIYSKQQCSLLDLYVNITHFYTLNVHNILGRSDLF